MRKYALFLLCLFCLTVNGAIVVGAVTIIDPIVDRSYLEATITWKTDVPTYINYVRYGKTPAYELGSVHAEGYGTEHLAKLTNLTMCADYYCQITSGYYIYGEIFIYDRVDLPPFQTLCIPNPPPMYPTIGAAKEQARPYPSPVGITGQAVITKVVTHDELLGDPPVPVTIQDGFYAQDITSGCITSGVFVETSDTKSGTVAEGATVTISSGLMVEQTFFYPEETVYDPEQIIGRTAIVCPTFTIGDTTQFAAIPLSIIAVGGPTISQGPVSPDTTGVWVSVVGRVNLASFTGGGYPYFYVDDCSGAIDDREAGEGMRIVLPWDAEIIPWWGDYVKVEGIAAYEITTGGTYTNVRTLLHPIVTRYNDGILFGPICASDISRTTANITWDTYVESTSQVAYDTAPHCDWGDYPNKTTVDSDLDLAHSVSLSGLTPETKYYFRVRSTNQPGYDDEESPEHTFTTTAASSICIPPPDPLVNTTQTGATISWTTTDCDTGQLLGTTGRVCYGKTESYELGCIDDPLPNSSSHTILLTGLDCGTTYYYKIVATATGYSERSWSSTFNTVCCTITINNVCVEDITDTQATIRWTTDVPATSEVKYGLAGCEISSGVDTIKRTNHLVLLTSLTPSTTYCYCVISTNDSSDPCYLPAEEGQFFFSTLNRMLYLGIGVSDITPCAVRVHWDTYDSQNPTLPVASTSQVEYAPTYSWNNPASHIFFPEPPLPAPLPGDPNQAGHSVNLPGLISNTYYTYRVWSTAPGYVTNPSATRTFHTATATVVVVSTSPPNEARDVPVDSVISATFNTEMDCSSFSPDSFTVKYAGNESVGGVVSCEDRTVTFTPTQQLANCTEYTATIKAGVEDISGNPLDSDYTWYFTTAGECQCGTIGAAKAVGTYPHPVCISRPAVITKVVTHEEMQGDPPFQVTIQDGFYAQDVIVTSIDPPANITGSGVYVSTSDTQNGAVIEGAKITSLSGRMLEESVTIGEQIIGRRVITNPSFTIQGDALYPAVAILQRDLMGPCIEQDLGRRLDTTSMRVRVFGRVNLASFTGGGEPYFQFDEASGAVDGREPGGGVRIVLPIDSEVIPTVKDYVMVEGIAAYEIITGGAYSKVRTILYPTVTILGQGIEWGTIVPPWP